MTTSTRRARVPLITVLLSACILALGAAVTLELWHGSQQAALLAVPADPLAIGEEHFDVPAQVDSGELQSQALFHASRSFYRAPAPPPQQRMAPDYRLAGVMRAPNQPATAILINNQTQARVRVHRGEVLEDWLVQEIVPGKVRLALDDKQVEITATSSTSSSSAANVASPGTAVLTGQPTSGLTRVPQAQIAQPRASAPLTTPRVLSAPGATAVPAAPAIPETEARLYRPPSP